MSYTCHDGVSLQGAEVRVPKLQAGMQQLSLGLQLAIGAAVGTCHGFGLTTAVL